MVDIAQWAGLVFIGLFYPIQNWRLVRVQNWRLVRGEEPIGLSFLAFCILAVGVGGFILLGMYLELWVLMGGNIANLIFCFAILLIVWIWSPTLSWGQRTAGLLVLVSGFAYLAAVHFFMPHDVAISIVGWVGAGGIVAFYPIQNAILFRKRDPTGLSLRAFFSLAIGLAFYTLLGFLVEDKTILFGNGFSFLGTLLILAIILRGKERTEVPRGNPQNS